MQFIVGLARPLLPERVREFGEIVKDLGGQVGSYIPHSSYLVILDQRRVEDLEALSCELSQCSVTAYKYLSDSTELGQCGIWCSPLHAPPCS